jgi:Flp pilus assembly protein TadG
MHNRSAGVLRLLSSARRRLRDLATATGATAAIEFALVAPIMATLLLNVIDFSLLLRAQLEVDNAAEAGALSAYMTCASSAEPATTNCSTMTSAITTAAQSTSLGTNVSLATGSPSETYYCATSSNTLQSVGAYSSPPSPFNCTAAGNSSETPGDYVSVSVNYAFTPIFNGLSFAPRETLTGSAIQRIH